ncbi:MAG: DUF2125 domain-containing protein [Nitratireductor sp.]
MNQTVLQKPKSKKTVITFVLLIILAIVAFTAFWFWAAQKITQTSHTLKTNLSNQGTVLNCENQEVKGYPFRLGVFCSSLSYANPIQGLDLSVSNIRSAAQLYKPGHFIVEIDAPLKLNAPKLAPLLIKWDDMRSSANISTSSFKRLSLEGKDITIAANDAGFESPIGSLNNLQLHLRPTPNKAEKNALDVSAALTKWQVVNNSGGFHEPLSIDINASLDQAMQLIQTRQDVMQYLKANGGSGVLNAATIKTDNGGDLQVSGPFEVSTNGRLSAKLTISLTEPKKLIDYATAIFPPLKNSTDEIMPFLEGFSNSTSGKTKIENLKININDGQIFLGFFQIGKVPRLF